jgi:hypothetical protein
LCFIQSGYSSCQLVSGVPFPEGKVHPGRRADHFTAIWCLGQEW